jgi:putative transposase
MRVVKQRVQRLMQQHGIRARGKRRFRVTTTDSRHDLPIAPNLLNRNFESIAPTYGPIVPHFRSCAKP